MKETNIYNNPVVLTEADTGVLTNSSEDLPPFYFSKFKKTSETKKKEKNSGGKVSIEQINSDYIYQYKHYGDFRDDLKRNYYSIKDKDTNNTTLTKYTYEDNINHILGKILSQSQIVAPDIKYSFYTYDDKGPDHIYVDFANKYLGGAFLTYGFAQEEIIFYEFFELFLTVWKVLKSESVKMGKNEVIVIKNAKRFFECNIYGNKAFENTEETLSESTNSKFKIIYEPRPVVDFLAIDGINKKYSTEDYLDDLIF